MRLIFSILSTAMICYGGYWFWQNNPDFRDFSQSFIKKQLSAKEFQTVEIRTSADQIMRAHKAALLPSHRYSFLDSQLTFHPYILIDVKFSHSSEKTTEGTILWSLSSADP